MKKEEIKELPTSELQFRIMASLAKKENLQSSGTNAAKNLLRQLKVSGATKRHLHITEEFLTDKNANPEEFLTQLGQWDAEDLEITKKFLKTR